MANESLVALPADVSDPTTLRRVLARIIELLDVNNGTRATATAENFVSQSDLTNLESTFETLLTKLESTVSTNTKLLSAIKATGSISTAGVLENTTNITLNKNAINANTDNIASNLAAINANTAAITALDVRVTALENP